jgi:hypothetical protein
MQCIVLSWDSQEQELASKADRFTAAVSGAREIDKDAATPKHDQEARKTTYSLSLRGHSSLMQPVSSESVRSEPVDKERTSWADYSAGYLRSKCLR